MRFTTEGGSNQQKTFASREDGTNPPILSVNSYQNAVCTTIPARAPMANPDYGTAVNGGVAITINTKTNDTLIGTGSKTYSVATPTYGNASINGSGVITYTPPTTNAFNGQFSFTYIVNNTNGADTANVYVTITNGVLVATNDAPSAANSGVVQSVNVRSNDSDPEIGTPNTTYPVTITVNPTHGTATYNNGTNQIDYTPTTGYSGTDVLTYQICEPTPGCGSANCTTATVTFTITNQPPDATNSNVPVVVCTPKTINLLSLATDPEGNILTISAIGALSTPSSGTLVNNNDGTVTFTPAAGLSVPVNITFTYTVSDGNSTDQATITLQISNPSNTAPDAVDDEPDGFTFTEILYYDVRGNDVDPEGQDISAPVIIEQPTHGTVTVESSGITKYTPDNSYVGLDTFRYRIYDRIANPATCTFTNGLKDSAYVYMILLPAPITVSGYIYNDVNGLNGSPANTVDGTGISSLSNTIVYVYLIDQSADTVVAVTIANEDGSYLFNNVIADTYSIQLSTTAADIGDASPAVALPSGWVNSGEYNGSGAGSDGSVNGILPSVTVTTSSISNLKLGVQQLATPATITAATQTNP